MISVFVLLYQARKRKLGLLEEEDDSKLLEDSNKNTNDFGNVVVAT